MRFWISTIALIAAIGFTTSAEPQQLAKSGKYAGKFGAEGVGQSYELEKDHVFFVGMYHGVFHNDVADGFLDKTEVVCPIAVDIVDGVNAGSHGHCIITDKDGDKAFSVYQGKGTGPGSASGTAQFTGGTGKYTGIQGNTNYHVTGIGKTTAISVAWEGDWRLP